MHALSTFFYRNLSWLLLTTLSPGAFAATEHSIAISGQGKVESASGNRDCLRAQSPCTFPIDGAYRETYTSDPANGWLHDAWIRCPETNGIICRFDLTATNVDQIDGEAIPRTVLRLRRPIRPLFRNNAGEFTLPQGAAPRQMRWVVQEIQSPNTTPLEIRNHFSPSFLEQVSIAELQARFDDLRGRLSNPEISDLITATPVFTRAIFHNPNSNSGGVFIAVNTTYANGGLITGFNYATGLGRNGSNVSAADVNKNFEQLGNSFNNVAENTSMLVAKIENDQCTAIFNRRGRRVQPTGSIFKLWVLGALAQEIRAGRIPANTMVPFDADEIVPAGARINDTPLNRQIPIRDLANLMIGVSDNTATDHLHELVGRTRIEQTLLNFGNRNPRFMRPFLSTNEQFHIFWSLSPTLANRYANSGDAQQRAILTNSIEPLGPVTEFRQNNTAALLKSSWAASAFDVCQAYAGLRRFNNRSAAYRIMDQAAGADAVLLSARKHWDRVWQKGGSLANNQGNYVLTLSWLFESDDKGAYVVVLMANNPDFSPIDSGPMFSIAARAEQILFNR